MIDGIIKADGTSRLVRSVADFKTRYPTYDAFAEALIAGTLPLDILFNAGGWSQAPDFLNKANLLKDTTAALFGLGTNAVPDDAFAVTKSLIDAANANTETKAKIAAASYVGTGAYGSAAPNTLTFDFEPFYAVITPTTYSPAYYVDTAGVAYVGRYGDAKLELVKSSQPRVIIEQSGNLVKSAPLSVSFNGNTIQWYIDSSTGVDESKGPTAQHNVSGTTYNVIAIGM